MSDMPKPQASFVDVTGLDLAEVTNVERLASRLRARGDEALCLRVRLLQALVEAAELAGDKAEARAFAMELTELCRARDRALSDAAPAKG